jgi:excisionase family DNA binding protein
MTPLLSVAECAAELGWPESRVIRWVRVGLLPAIEDGRRHWIRRADLTALVDGGYDAQRDQTRGCQGG